MSTTKYQLLLKKLITWQSTGIKNWAREGSHFCTICTQYTANTSYSRNTYTLMYILGKPIHTRLTSALSFPQISINIASKHFLCPLQNMHPNLHFFFKHTFINKCVLSSLIYDRNDKWKDKIPKNRWLVWTQDLIMLSYRMR